MACSRKPPHEAKEEDLIEVWHDGAEFVGVHAADMDVTGGIGLKVQRARSIAQHGIETWFVNGEVEGRLEAAMLGRPCEERAFHPRRRDEVSQATPVVHGFRHEDRCR